MRRYELDIWTQRWTENWLNCQVQIFLISAHLQACWSSVQWSPITSGVPQVSILGLILLNTLITELDNGAERK